MFYDMNKAPKAGHGANTAPPVQRVQYPPEPYVEPYPQEPL